ncbi:MAG: hypothetical protein KJ607_04590 [Bacteroidetes bacterium]|nr:hypothetical protein [Bacteroidota bacterium]
MTGYWYIKLRSKQKFVIGLRITWCRRYVLNYKARQICRFIDYYAGFGARYIFSHSITYGHAYGYAEIDDLIPSVPPLEEKRNMLIPTVHIGCRYGLAWKRTYTE